MTKFCAHSMCTGIGGFVNNFPMAAKIFRINMTSEDEKRDLDNLNKFLESNVIISTQEEFIRGKVDRWLVFVKYYKIGDTHSVSNENHIPQEKNENAPVQNKEPEQVDEHLKEIFMAWRKEKALEEGVPLYRIITNAAVDEVIKNLPEQVGKLHLIKGIGPATQDNYGSEIIAIIKNYKEGII